MEPLEIGLFTVSQAIAGFWKLELRTGGIPLYAQTREGAEIYAELISDFVKLWPFRFDGLVTASKWQNYQIAKLQYERDLLYGALDQAKGNQKKAADSLGMKRTSFLARFERIDSELERALNVKTNRQAKEVDAGGEDASESGADS